MPFVKVVSMNTGIGFVTNFDGEFNLSSMANQDSIRVKVKLLTNMDKVTNPKYFDKVLTERFFNYEIIEAPFEICREIQSK